MKVRADEERARKRREKQRKRRLRRQRVLLGIYDEDEEEEEKKLESDGDSKPTGVLKADSDLKPTATKRPILPGILRRQIADQKTGLNEGHEYINVDDNETTVENLPPARKGTSPKTNVQWSGGLKGEDTAECSSAVASAVGVVGGADDRSAGLSFSRITDEKPGVKEGHEVINVDDDETPVENPSPARKGKSQKKVCSGPVA